MTAVITKRIQCFRYGSMDRSTSGFTLVELMIGLVVLSLVLGSVCMVVLGTHRLFSEQWTRVYLDQTGARVMDRLSSELRAAYFPTMTPVVLADSTWVRYQPVTGFAGGAAQLGGFATLQMELAAGEADNDIDDDGDGLADEGVVTYIADDGTRSRIADNVLALRIDSTAAGLLIAVDVAVTDYRGEPIQRTYTREICLRNRG